MKVEFNQWVYYKNCWEFATQEPISMSFENPMKSSPAEQPPKIKKLHIPPQDRKPANAGKIKPEEVGLSQEQIWDATGAGPRAYHEQQKHKENIQQQDPLSGLDEEQKTIRRYIIEGAEKRQAIDLGKALEKILTPEERNFWDSHIGKIAYSEGQISPEETKRFKYLTVRLGLKQAESESATPPAIQEKVLTPQQEAQQLVENQKDFLPTKDFVSPSLFTGRNIDDMAAVIAGRKPAAIIREADVDKMIVPELFKMAQEQGYVIEQTTGFGGTKIYIVGQRENVGRINGFMHRYVERNFADENYHWMLGRLLGYPEESIKDFLVKWKQLRANEQKVAETEPKQTEQAQPEQAIEQSKPKEIREVKVEEVAKIIEDGIAQKKNMPGIWSEIAELYGIKGKGIAKNLEDAQSIWSKNIPFRLEESGDNYKIIWPRAGDEMGFLGDIMRKYPKDYSRIIANYLNQAFKNIKG